ncbi:MAG: formylglycine-generating enzyme family protein [Sedimenticola sp.]
MSSTEQIPGSYRQLLAQLQRSGLQVTPQHHIQLGHILEQEPRGGADQLRRILRAMLVKSPTQAEHFDRIYGDWQSQALARLEQATQTVPEPKSNEAPATPQRANQPDEPRQPGISKSSERHWIKWLGVVVLAALLLVITLYYLPPDELRSNPPVIQPPTANTTQETPTALPLEERTFTYLAPQVTFEPNRTPLWPWGLVALLGMAGLLFLRIKVAPRGFPRSPGALVATQPGSHRPQPPEKGPSNFRLLNDKQRRSMAWGLEKFLSEQTTRRLDQYATVDATARQAGILTPVFQGAQRDRTVWLWLDESTPDAAAVRLADELHQQLKAAGIPVQRANYWGTPDHLVTREGRHLRPQDLDDQRREIVLIILSDGQKLLRDLRQPWGGQSKSLMTLLRQWPELVLVDFSRHEALKEVASQYQLQRVSPAGLANHLGRDRQQPDHTRRSANWGDEGVWAAAAAFSPTGCSERELLALPETLGLKVDPWVLSELASSATDGTQRRQWPLPERAQRLRWLTSLGDLTTSGLPADGSPLSDVLRYWDRHYSRSIDAFPQEQALNPQRLRLRMEQALVRLWYTPDSAAAALWELASYRGEPKDPGTLLGKHIQAQLAMHAPADHQAEELITLPWRSDQISAATRSIVQKLGLGGDLPQEILTQPGRYWLAMGGAAGTIATALLGGWLSWQSALQTPLEIVDGDQPQPLHRVSVLSSDAGNRERGTVVHPRGADLFASPSGGQRATLNWRESTAPCYEVKKPWELHPTSAPMNQEERLYYDRSQTIHLRCSGQVPGPRLAGDNIPRSVAVLFSVARGDGYANDPAARRQLAERLIAGGTVDEAIIVDRYLAGGTVDKAINVGRYRTGNGSFSPLELLQETRHTQLLLFSTEADASRIDLEPADLPRAAWVQVKAWPEATDRLRFEGVRTLEETFAREQVTLLSGVVDRLRVGGTAPPIPLPDLVQIKGGCFLMGSPKDEPGRASDEGPQHEVCLEDFLMARHETTFEQYDAFAKATGRELPRDREWGRGRRPVIGVDWNDAKAYTRWLSSRVGLTCDLPSEAQWEYAARADTKTSYALPAPGGSDDISGKNLANCNGCGSEWDSKQTAPTGSFAPNSWGLHDMHGNIWEWVQDPWHDNYEGVPTNGSAREEPSGEDSAPRVLRGGSWFFSPDYLRSAFRFRRSPVNRSFVIGFRVLCRPHAVDR